MRSRTAGRGHFVPVPRPLPVRCGGRGLPGARRPSGMDADGLPIVGSGIDLTKVRAAPRPGLGCWAGLVPSRPVSPPLSCPAVAPVRSHPLRLRPGSGRSAAEAAVQGHGARAELGVTGGRPRRRSKPGRLPERDLGVAPRSALQPLLCGCPTPAFCNGLSTGASWPP